MIDDKEKNFELYASVFSVYSVASVFLLDAHRVGIM